jgi:hypothetical protein
MVLTYEAEEDFEARQDTERSGAYWSAWAAFGGALKSAGIVSDMHGLHRGETASTIRIRNGARYVATGPFAVGGTQLGGYFIIDVEGKEAATEWAAKCPAALRGAVEIRPVL